MNEDIYTNKKNSVVKGSENFICYEYKEVNVPRELEDIFIESYPSLGWKLEGVSHSFTGRSDVALKFGRDSRISHKIELLSLQKSFEHCIHEIVKIKQSTSSSALVVALSMGLIGAAILSGSIFALINDILVPLMIFGIIIGLAGIVFPYLVFRKINEKRNDLIKPLLDEKYQEIEELCKKGQALLGE